MKNLLFSVLSVGLVVLFVFFSGDAFSGMFLKDSEGPQRVWPAILIAFAMLAGIVAGRMHNKLTSTERLQPRKFLTGFARDKELWKSLLASPIVFGVVYGLLSKSNDLVVSAIFSFQNGFFCNVILEKKEKEMSATDV